MSLRTPIAINSGVAAFNFLGFGMCNDLRAQSICFFSAPTGESWHLVRGDELKDLHIGRMATDNKTGPASLLTIGEFLNARNFKAEHIALLELIDALVK